MSFGAIGDRRSWHDACCTTTISIRTYDRYYRSLIRQADPDDYRAMIDGALSVIWGSPNDMSDICWKIGPGCLYPRAHAHYAWRLAFLIFY
jgi:hypothetical protein